MALRWCAAGMVEAGTRFRRVNGHRHLADTARDAPKRVRRICRPLWGPDDRVSAAWCSPDRHRSSTAYGTFLVAVVSHGSVGLRSDMRRTSAGTERIWTERPDAIEKIASNPVTSGSTWSSSVRTRMASRRRSRRLWDPPVHRMFGRLSSCQSHALHGDGERIILLGAIPRVGKTLVRSHKSGWA
jgi:hypothetical protein